MSGTLADKVFEKVKDQLGDLITQEDLKPLVERAVNEAFFTPRGYKNNYGSWVDQGPPRFVELIEGAMKEAVSVAVKAEFAAKPNLIPDALDRAIAKGFTAMVLGAVDDMARGPMYELANNLRSKGLLNA